jgi:hypothetical protein
MWIVILLFCGSIIYFVPKNKKPQEDLRKPLLSNQRNRTEILEVLNKKKRERNKIASFENN